MHFLCVKILSLPPIYWECFTKKIKCISNCVFPCERGKGANRVGYCIADSLGDAYLGRLQSGLFFSGANGWRLKKLVPVKDLIDELMTGIS